MAKKAVKEAESEPQAEKPYSAAGFNQEGVAVMIDQVQFETQGLKPAFTEKKRAEIIARVNGMTRIDDVMVAIRAAQ